MSVLSKKYAVCAFRSKEGRQILMDFPEYFWRKSSALQHSRNLNMARILSGSAKDTVFGVIDVSTAKRHPVPDVQYLIEDEFAQPYWVYSIRDMI